MELLKTVTNFQSVSLISSYAIISRQALRNIEFLQNRLPSILLQQLNEPEPNFIFKLNDVCNV